jgi:hypothetical protein
MVIISIVVSIISIIITCIIMHHDVLVPEEYPSDTWVWDGRQSEWGSWFMRMIIIITIVVVIIASNIVIIRSSSMIIIIITIIATPCDLLLCPQASSLRRAGRRCACR